MNSFFSGTIYENADNPANPYDSDQALKLLAEAGWKERDAQGRLLKDGRPFQLEMLYDSKQSETYLTVYQEDLRKAGINLNLDLDRIRRFRIFQFFQPQCCVQESTIGVELA